MHCSEFVHNIVDKLISVQGMQAIVLGGSWASGTQRPDSDIDLGLYYAANQPLNIQQVRNITIELNDIPNPVATDLGEWGRWVNGGAWLTIQGQHVDFLYRNIDFVASIIDDCNKGNIGAIGSNREELSESLQAAEALVGEMIALCGNQYRARY